MGRRAGVRVVAVLAGVLAGVVVPVVASAAVVVRVPCSTPALVSAVSRAAGGSTLSLARGCAYVLRAALPQVGRDLTVDGNGAMLLRSTVRGTAAFAILTITGGTVRLNQLSFVHGHGAIVMRGGAGLIVTGGVFRDNTAANGGAIDNTGVGSISVTGVSFTGNTATGRGGAIYDRAGEGDWISACDFAGNAAEYGGAVAGPGPSALISDSVFHGNRATTGGALDLDAASAPRITGTVISGNSATRNGGGIHDGSTGGYFSIDDSEITGNTAGGAGGGLDEESDSYQASIISVIIEGNSAADGGGVKEGAGVGAQYFSDTISGNRARRDGGGIDAVNSTITLSGTAISGNHAGGDGGGIANSTGARSPSAFSDGSISGNHAGGRGGGLYSRGPVSVSSTRITRNRAAGGGGGIYDDGAAPAVTLTNTFPAGNVPDNCEPHRSIAGCAG